jgi:peptidyl-tRNA hydrolase
VKIFLVTRGDLAPGVRAAQLCHALRQLAAEHPELDARWFAESNTLVLLEVSDEPALAALAVRARDDDIPVAAFHEPDLGGSLTAVALGPAARRLVRRLPLAYSRQ